MRVFIIISLAVMLISAAVIFSVIRAVLPHATTYKNEISQEISRQIGLPVEIDSIDAVIRGFSPRLKLIGVSVFDKKNKDTLFNFREAFAELDVYASIIRGEIIIANVGMVGADISIEKFSDSEWSIQGIKITRDGKSELPDQFLYMLQNADYLLHDSNIYYQDHSGEKLKLNLLDVNITVENFNNKHDIKLSMNLPQTYGRNLFVVANLHGGIGALAGDIYLEANQLNIKKWNKRFNLSEAYQVDAVVDVDLWVTLINNNIQTLITQLAVKNLSISNNSTNKQWQTDYLSTKIRYSNESENWNVAVSDFYFGKQAQPVWEKTVSLITSYDNEHYYLTADFLRIDDVQAVAEVFLSSKQLSELDSFTSYQIQADIYNINLKLPSVISKQQLLENLNLEASVTDFSMFDSKNNIRLSGFDAFLRYGNKRAEIDVATQDATVYIKGLFREPLFAKTLQGDLIIEYQDDKWQLNTNRLQLKNRHINTFSRLNIQLSSSENIFVDVQTDFYDAYGKYAKHYLPVGIMKPALVDWLDMAVTDGYVSAGSFILQGNLNDFPYYQDEGVFQVLFPLQDVNMQFLEDWPVLTETSAMVKFHNQSLFVTEAKATTQGAFLTNGSAQILDLDDAHLTVGTQAQDKTEAVQSYVYNSPLDEILGDALRLFQFDGDSQLTLKLDVPLNAEANTPEAEVTIDGQIKFLNAEMFFPNLGYELSEINGVVNFTEDSIFADSMKAKMPSSNKPDHQVTISAVTQEGRSGREVVFHLDGVMQTDYLLQYYEWLPEDWMSGESMWGIDIEIPYEAKDYLVHIKADSLLEGALFKLSDKVKKRPDRKIRFSTQIDVLDNEGLQINAKASTALANKVDNKSGDIFDLFAVRNESKHWNFTIDSELITGKGSFAEGLGKDTSIQLAFDSIDLYALFSSEGGDGTDKDANKYKAAQPLNPSDFPPLIWRAKKVLWDGRVFTDVKVETNWHEHGMLIDTVSFVGAAMTFKARGTWLTSWRGLHESVLQGTMTSSNLGDTLVGLGLSRSLDHGNFTATFNSKWSAEPHQLSWANMKGRVSFEMFNGEVLDVDPGTGGRLLGLFNIVKLTNRLILDFDDVTAKGFAFDSIKGDFEFVHGNGSLKNFDVIASTADINMFGSIGLVEQDYDLLMRVKPHADGLTFAGGVLLGGVAVGAGLALIQKIFDLGILGHDIYSITGSWDEPKVDKIIERSLTDDSAEDDEF